MYIWVIFCMCYVLSIIMVAVETIWDHCTLYRAAGFHYSYFAVGQFWDWPNDKNALNTQQKHKAFWKSHGPAGHSVYNWPTDRHTGHDPSLKKMTFWCKYLRRVFLHGTVFWADMYAKRELVAEALLNSPPYSCLKGSSLGDVIGDAPSMKTTPALMTY